MRKNNIFTDWTEEDARRHNERVRGTAALTPPVRQSAPTQVTLPEKAVKASQGKCGSRQPNKTEQSAMTMLGYEFSGCKIVYEGITLRLDNSMKYTPDVNVHLPDGKILLVEVKNAGFKHASYGRSKMAFSQCKLDYPQFEYRWMVKDKSEWTIK
jgi:hypothetical protein